MVEFYLIPSWFFSFGFILELIFAIVTLGVSLYSFKVYKYSQIRECRLFGWAFLAFSLSYFIWAGVSGYVGLLVGSSFQGIYDFNQISLLVVFGVYSHIILFLLAVITLTYMTLGIKNIRTYSLLAVMGLGSVLFSQSKIISFYFISSILFLYVLSFYMLRWKKKTFNNLFILLSFVFLFVGTLDFMFSAAHHINYVAGHIFYLIGYSFMLVNFILMFLRLRK